MPDALCIGCYLLHFHNVYEHILNYLAILDYLQEADVFIVLNSQLWGRNNKSKDSAAELIKVCLFHINFYLQ